MGAPVAGMEAGEPSEAATLLESFRSIDPTDKARHAAVLDYWLSIRGDREIPPIRDLDPLAISDAGPSSILLELIGGGEDAEVRHLGEALRSGAAVERILDAPRPSPLASIAAKLSIVAISRNFLSFEDEFASDAGTTRCWVTLLPFSAAGAWVDFVYGFVTWRSDSAAGEEPAEQIAEEAPAATEHDVLELEVEDVAGNEEIVPTAAAETEEEEPVALEQSESETLDAAEKKPGFSKFFDALSSVGAFYGTPVRVEPTLPSAPAAAEPSAEAAEEPLPAEPEPEPPAQLPAEQDVAEEQPVEEPQQAAEAEDIDQPDCVAEGALRDRLGEVRAKADEARMAKLRANAALYEGLAAAYDFALDAEEAPEEYLRLVEAHGLKIQLRSPMTPVVKLAFDGLCDDATIGQLEAVLAWALRQDLPRGSLAERIEAAGGIGPILSGKAAA